MDKAYDVSNINQLKKNVNDRRMPTFVPNLCKYHCRVLSLFLSTCIYIYIYSPNQKFKTT